MKIFVDYCDCCMLASSSQNILTMGFSDVSGTAFMHVSIHFIFLFFLFFCFVGLLIFAQRSEMNIFE
jgi:hypothetical protein